MDNPSPQGIAIAAAGEAETVVAEPMVVEMSVGSVGDDRTVREAAVREGRGVGESATADAPGMTAAEGRVA